MNKYFLISCLLIYISSCKIQPDSSRHYTDGNPDKVYKLHLNPSDGAIYYYNITNESKFKLEVNDKSVENQSKATVGVSYAIHKDSVVDFQLDMVYDKIHLYSKNGDTETDMDADNVSESLEPGDKLLGILKGATIKVVINPLGAMKSVNGYDAIKEKIMTALSLKDSYARAVVEKQWDQRIKEGLIKKNMEQLFRIFPDSAVHVGDRWKLSSEQRDEFSINVRNSYTLKSIHDGIATIHCEGDLVSDSSSGNSMGYAFTADLKGKQEGEFEMEMSTGMLMSGEIDSNIAGDMNTMGKNIPIVIHSAVKIKGRKVN